MMNLRYINMVFVIPAIMFYHTSCKKNKVTGYHNEAEITSIDNSLRPCNSNDPCNCLGGFYIHIDNMPDPQGRCISCTSFKAMKLPEGFGLDDNVSFPVKVSIDWKYDSLSCDSSRIIIKGITRR